MENIRMLYVYISELANLENTSLGYGKVAETLSGMTLGEIILLTNNFKTHKGIRNVGDKKLHLIKQIIQETEEYKAIQKEFNI